MWDIKITAYSNYNFLKQLHTNLLIAKRGDEY